MVVERTVDWTRLERADLEALVLLKLWREMALPARVATEPITRADDGWLRRFLAADGFSIACAPVDGSVLSQARAYARGSTGILG